MTAHDTVSDASNQVRVIRDGEESRVVDLTDEATGAPPDLGAGLTEKVGALRRHYQLFSWVLVVIDVLCLAVALLAAHGLRFGSLPGRGYLAAILAAGLVWVLVFHAFGLYAPQHLSGLEEFRRTVSAIGIGIVLVILLTFWLEVYLSRSWIALTLIIALALEVTARRIVRNHERRSHRHQTLVVRTLVVGNGDSLREPTEALDMQDSGLVPIGFIDVTSPLFAPAGASPVELVTRLRAALRQHRPDCVLVASPMIGTRRMVAVTQAARLEGVLVRIYTHLSGIWASRLTVQDVGRQGVVLTLRPARLSRLQRLVKRGMDVGLAGIGLIVASPVLVVAAVAIKMTSRGPVLFRQQRVTEGARNFQMYKLRTMTDGLDPHADQDPIDRSAAFFKLREDPRLTKVGGWLRRTSIDELPQLFNVLVGDMSLVGPRPLPAEQVAANIELLGPRHEVRAGITGWWQIHGRADLVEPEEAVRMDHFYIENWSPILDLYVLLRTAGALFTRKGAY